MNKNSDGSHEFKIYKWRFLVLLTVVFLNISNATLWISYSPVATTVANYYGVAPQKVNWFSLVFLIISLPFCFISTIIINKFGLKVGIYVGAILNCVGGIIRAFGTSNVLPQTSQYGISLLGQTIAAMAQSFLLFIPTKVSQLWFPESQRAIATTVLAMSNPLGIVIAQGTTPLIVDNDENKIPLNNYIWMGLALFSFILTLVCIRSEKPKTPPSLSALTGELDRPPYLQQLKNVFTSFSYMMVLLTLGAGVGIFTTISTLTQQLLCPLGYSDVFGGVLNVVMVLAGFCGSAVAGILVDKTKLFAEVTKTAFGFAALSLIFFLEFFLFPNENAALIIFSVLFGFFGIGAYPTGLELAVEITFPVEETISTAFIFLSGQVSGIVGIVIIPALSTVQESSLWHLNVCETDQGFTYNNYSIPLLIIMAYMSALSCIMILFMNPTYRRHLAERRDNKKSEENKGFSHELQNDF